MYEMPQGFKLPTIARPVAMAGWSRPWATGPLEPFQPAWSKLTMDDLRDLLTDHPNMPVPRQASHWQIGQFFVKKGVSEDEFLSTLGRHGFSLNDLAPRNAWGDLRLEKFEAAVMRSVELQRIVTVPDVDHRDEVMGGAATATKFPGAGRLQRFNLQGNQWDRHISMCLVAASRRFDTTKRVLKLDLPTWEEAVWAIRLYRQIHGRSGQLYKNTDVWKNWFSTWPSDQHPFWSTPSSLLRWENFGNHAECLHDNYNFVPSGTDI